MLIRPFIADDRQHIVKMLKTNSTFAASERSLALEIIDQYLAQPPEKEDYIMLSACIGLEKVFAGYICFGAIPLTTGCYDLYWILVDKKFSRRGIGGELLLAMEEILFTKKARRIYIDTSSSEPYEPARNFYENNGFTVASILEDFYRPGDDKVIYLKNL